MRSENPNKNSILKWIGLIALLILLVSAAFVGGQLLNRTLNPQGVRNFVAAEELPQTQPDALGLLVRREDNSLFMGTGGINIDAEIDGVPVLSYDGPVVEVVVNSETHVYQDVTALPGPFSSGEIQQEVAEGTIEEIDETHKISVWGRKVGDRIIADVLLYSAFTISHPDGRAPQLESP